MPALVEAEEIFILITGDAGDFEDASKVSEEEDCRFIEGVVRALMDEVDTIPALLIPASNCCI